MTLSAFDETVFPIFVVLSFLFFILGADDVFIDLVSVLLKTGSKRITRTDIQEIGHMPEKRIAVMVANWKESDVLSRMVRGNLSRLNYKNVVFYLGVYPNDTETVVEAKGLAQTYTNVRVVVNEKDGPTSKGQMLNQVVREIVLHGGDVDILLMQDSEDIMDPDSLRLINMKADTHQYIQIPVISLPVSPWTLVAPIYLDEFAESHMKDMPVRERLSGTVPSAGVGTAMSRDMVISLTGRGATGLFKEASVTEDYVLGMETALKGYRATFACYEITEDNGTRHLIATREYFPKKIWRSVKQKTRWSLGICFQSWQFLGWRGNLWTKYFLYRDRKGPVSNALATAGLGISTFFLLRFLNNDGFAERFWNYLESAGLDRQLFFTLLCFNIAFMSNRVFQRVRFGTYLYSWKFGTLVVPRMIVGNFINAIAGFRAGWQYAASRLAGVQPKWSKTEHEIPEGFGEETSPTVPTI